MPRSEAHVRTPRSRPHLVHLCEHFATAVPVKWTADQGLIDLGFGTCRIDAADDGLSLHADSPDDIGLARVEYLVGEHLERAGARESLVVDWQPAAPEQLAAPDRAAGPDHAAAPDQPADS